MECNFKLKYMIEVKNNAKKKSFHKFGVNEHKLEMHAQPTTHIYFPKKYWTKQLEATRQF